MTAAATRTRHPYEHTLGLMELAIRQLPPTFSEKRRKRFATALERFDKNPGVPYEEIQRTISELGRESWAYRKAYEEMYGRYGRSSEEAFLLEGLDLGIREKYERFIHEGGKLNHIESAKSGEDIRIPSPFERFFTPEEKFAIEQALVEARRKARGEIDGLVTVQKKEEYDELVKRYAGREEVIESKINELRDLAAVSAKWNDAILEEVRTLEEGWSVVERGVDEERLNRTLDHWRGTLESFLGD